MKHDFGLVMIIEELSHKPIMHLKDKLNWFNTFSLTPIKDDAKQKLVMIKGKKIYELLTSDEE